MFFYFDKFYYYFLTYPLVIKIATIFIIVFIIFNCSLLIYFLVLQLKKIFKKKAVKINKKNKTYQIFEQISVHKKKIPYEDIVSNLNNFKATCKESADEIIAILLDVKKNHPIDFNYFNAQGLSRLFDLGKHWDNNLSSGNLTTKMRSLDEVINLNASISESILSTLVYHNNHELRKRARLAQIHLSLHDPFRFFEEEFDIHFTDWDKLKIHNILKRRTISTIPNFARWIPNIKNDELISLFIFEIGFYKQYENREFLFDLFKIAKSDIVKVEILETLKILGIEEYKDDFTKLYPICSEKVQKSIVKNLSSITDDNKLLRFYVMAFEKTFETELRVEIGKVIFNSGLNGKKTIEILHNKSVGFDRLIFEHVKNPLLN